ncbi:hypothetical protein CAPTEDRAFT_191927 [Capitella teleta]|uniref:GH3 domain-containing protein n=1 Tax=Capitella teleta TaxID=283909 RepID=R7VCR9_CAPTE|nr:hypothetical protein CAPTEDRAFT_191927 [Capitella teleta]|eukprot:ELU16623.1 hypothetical protein CAPTEDRAFT_191927 [Capitella teleta]
MFEKLAKGCLAVGGTVGVISVSYIVWDIYCKRSSKLHSWSSMFNQNQVNGIMKGVGRLVNNGFNSYSKDCVKTQESTLLQFIKENSDTIYGRDHSFSQIHNRDDFVRLHPLTIYEHYESYIDRVYNGEENVITKAMPAMFGVTSGTSGEDTTVTPFYVIYVELDSDQNLTEKDKNMVDEALCQKSYAYKSFRTKNSIQTIEVRVVSSGTFRALKQFLMTKSETSANQFKVPRVVKRKEAVEFLQTRILH